LCLSEDTGRLPGLRGSENESEEEGTKAEEKE
jgi:hypothetical protein